MQTDVGGAVATHLGGKVDGRSARILARAIFKDMQEYGVPEDRILEVASELIGLVTEKIEHEPA